MANQLVIVLVFIALALYTLSLGMAWLALGLFVVMLLFMNERKDFAGGYSQAQQQFQAQRNESESAGGPPTQLLKVKSQPDWGGNDWWEESALHWGKGLGGIFGLMR